MTSDYDVSSSSRRMLSNIQKYFPALTSNQLHQLEALLPLYMDWNAKINVISRKDIDNLYERHVLHSLAIAKFISFVPGTNVIDIGSGGGFPGIPLAILFPETKFLLVDSVGKKIKVVEAVAAAIGLKNVSALHSRVEQVNEKFDFAVSRAVTDLPELLSWVRGKIKKEQINSLPNGIIYLRGEERSGSLNGFNPPVTVKNLSEYFSEDFFKTKIVVHFTTKG